MRFLKESPEFDFNYLNNLTAVDYLQYFEVIYNLTSMNNKQTLMVKSRLSGRENLEIPSVTHLWQGADVQEREVFDLLGIRFIGHPNLKRIALWEGFEGHPLRQDFL
jgi:NADH-quinone oxidoreductase subunit C